MVNIRQLEESDEDLLTKFFTSLSDETLTWQNHFGKPKDWYEAHNIAFSEANYQKHGYIVIEENKCIAYGWLDFGKKPEQRFTCSLALVVADLWQGKGIGRQLCEYMISEARKLGMRKIWLNAYSKNFRALKMYDKLGFIEEGVFRKQEWTKDNLPLDLYSLALFL